MADKTKTEFEKVGTVNADALNLSGAASPNTITVPRKNGKSDEVPATQAHRQAKLERNGFIGAPQVAYSYPNAPEAQSEGRNVRLVPSAKGNRDFYARRQFGQGV